MDLPPNTNLPFFTYGLFKPDELAYRRIEHLISHPPIRTTIHGSLVIRDGLPLLRCGHDKVVTGYVLYFSSDKSQDAYRIIADVEPENHYRWTETNIDDIPERVNVLVGRSPEKGSSEYEEQEWSGRSDPVFVHALRLIDEIAKTSGHQKFSSAPPDSFDWDRLFQLQMAYLLLWSAIERYCSLRFGSNLNPMEKVNHLGEDLSFKKYLKQVLYRSDRVYDSRKPNEHKELNAEKPKSSVHYYYLVRSNLSHRGKGAWQDGEIIRQSLNELLEIFSLILKEYFELYSTSECI